MQRNTARKTAPRPDAAGVRLDRRAPVAPINPSFHVDSAPRPGADHRLTSGKDVAAGTSRKKPSAGTTKRGKRQLLIDVATKQFAELGYDGARVDSIVEECKVSKNLLYHYFESKEALFIAVMEQAYASMREEQNEWSFAELEPEDAIAKLVIVTFEHFLRQPTIISLLNTENLHKAKHIAQSSKIPQLYDPLLKTINELLARGKKLKKFKDHIDPVDLYITIAGLGYFYLSNSYTLSFVLGEDLMTKERLAQRRKHMVEVVLAYIRR
jgi:TetR/AcrR family transcriptional regulator